MGSKNLVLILVSWCKTPCVKDNVFSILTNQWPIFKALQWQPMSFLDPMDPLERVQLNLRRRSTIQEPEVPIAGWTESTARSEAHLSWKRSRNWSLQSNQMPRWVATGGFFWTLWGEILCRKPNWSISHLWSRLFLMYDFSKWWWKSSLLIKSEDPGLIPGESKKNSYFSSSRHLPSFSLSPTVSFFSFPEQLSCLIKSFSL